MSNESENQYSDLEVAMRSLHKSQQNDASANMDSTGMEQDEAQSEQQGAVEQSTEQNEEQSEVGYKTSDNTQQSNSGEAGGYAASSTGDAEPDYEEVTTFDYNQIGRAYIDTVNKMAANSTNRLFRENNVRKATINDLYTKDKSGRVSFTNPDDPNRPFSSRYEAQQWVESFNNQIDEEWRTTARQYQSQYARDIMPTLNMIKFGAKFDRMSEAEQDIFDSVIEQYAVKDPSGDVIGYSCDLDAAAATAKRIYERTGSNKQQAQQQVAQTKVQGTGPAIDAKTSGSNNAQNQTKKTPKTMSEAFQIINAEKKAARTNKK